MRYDPWWWDHELDRRGDVTAHWNPQKLPPFPISGLFTPEREEACVAEGRFGVPDLQAAASWLDGRYQRRGAGWVELVDTDRGPWLRAAVWPHETRYPSVCVEAVSREAYARVADELAEAVPEIKPRGAGVRRSFGFPQSSFGWGVGQSTLSDKARRDRPTPGPEEQLDAVLEHEEQRWLDAPNPLLDDRSPREAVKDPEWVAAVYELLTWIERCYYSGPDERVGLTACFDPARLRLKLGIGRAWDRPVRHPVVDDTPF